MGAQAVALARAVDYRSAGTVEFIVDPERKFYFLEMNTRLQVEHPVTELITGLDIVAEQIRIARGEPLGYGQDDIRFTGHAIECRLYAEDADAGFLPATGHLHLLRLPHGEGIRVDNGVQEGQDVSAAFDPMLAKIAAHGADRAEAIARLREAMRDTVALGTITNAAYLERVLAHPRFASGDTHTGFLSEHADALRALPPDAEAARRAARRGGADASAVRRARSPARSRSAPWASGGTDERPPRSLRATSAASGGSAVKQTSHWSVRSTRHLARRADSATLAFGGRRSPLRRCRMSVPANTGSRSTARPIASGSPCTAATHTSTPSAAPGSWKSSTRSRARSARRAAATRSRPRRCPGTVVKIMVAAGDAVHKGQPLLVIESMKMQTEIAARRDGTVEQIFVTENQTFDRGARLVALAVEGPGSGGGQRNT